MYEEVESYFEIFGIKTEGADVIRRRKPIACLKRFIKSTLPKRKRQYQDSKQRNLG